MMKKPHLLILAFFFIIPSYIFAGIEGTYEAKGFDPLTDSEYTAILVIQKVNDSIFNAEWTFTSGASGIVIGTGVRKGKNLSFVFSEASAVSTGAGTQLYKIERHDVLKGPWVRLGATEKGFERAKKVSD